MAENTPRRDPLGTRARNDRKDKPEGSDQYSGFVSTTAAVGGALAVGAFLWSSRNQISKQAGRVAARFSRRREGDHLDDNASGSGAREDSRTQAEIAAEALTLKDSARRHSARIQAVWLLRSGNDGNPTYNFAFLRPCVTMPSIIASGQHTAENWPKLPATI